MPTDRVRADMNPVTQRLRRQLPAQRTALRRLELSGRRLHMETASLSQLVVQQAAHHAETHRQDRAV